MDRIVLFGREVKGKIKMTEMISIILPFYNVKKEYMEACMQSIGSQTFQNWEAIIIDDGSDKTTAKWLDSYRTPQIRVIHQENAGVSAARNRGIQEAKGEWIYFCDSDDLMKENELEVLYKSVQETESDVAVCRHEIIDIYGNKLKKEQPKEKDKHITISPDELLFELTAPRIMMDSKKINLQIFSLVYPWAHLYRTECVRNITFPIGMHPGEDRIFNMLVCKNVKRIVLVNEELHWYRVGYGVTSHYNKKYLDNSRYERKLVQEIMRKYESNTLYKSAMAKAEAEEMAFLMKIYFFNKDNPLGKNERVKEFYQYVKSDMKYYPEYVLLRTLTQKQILLWVAYRTRVIYLLGLLLSFK